MEQDPTNKQLVFHLNEYLNNENLSHRRRKNFAPKELNIIISMVEENAELIYNRVNKNPKFISKQEFWQTVTSLINENCHYTAKRDVKEVRRKWVTFQSEVKSKAREGTHLLNLHEKRVWDLIQVNSVQSEGGGVLSADQQDQRLTMLPGNRQLSGGDQFNDSVSGIGSDQSLVMEQISQNNSPASSLSSNTSFGNATQNGGVKMEGGVNEAELLMNICSQVMGLSSGEITAQVGGAIKDIISKPGTIHKVNNNTTTTTHMPVTSAVSPITAPTVTPILASLPAVTPARNVISVQPVNHVQTPPKRARLDATPTNPPAEHPPAIERLITDYLKDIVEQQKHANRIAEERLLVEKQRRDLETEKLEIEKARYEIEKERLCQEIISRKKP